MNVGSKNAGVKYAGVFLMAIGIYPTIPSILVWLSNNLSPHYTRATGESPSLVFEVKANT